MGSKQTVVPNSKCVLVGAGFTHLQLLKRLAEQPIPGLEVILITDIEKAPYIGMLSGSISGLYRSDEIYIEIRPVVEKAEGKIILANIKSIDPLAKKLTVTHLQGDVEKNTEKHAEKIDYDYLSIDAPAAPDPLLIPGAQEFGHFVKPIAQYQKAILDFCNELRGKKKVTLVQIGAGPAGVECALAFKTRLESYWAEVTIHFIDSADRILPTVHQRASTEFGKVCEENKAVLHLAESVEQITAKEVLLKSGEKITYDFVSIATTPVPPTWIGKTGLELHHGFLKVNHFLQTSSPAVFAAGEVVVDPERPWPRSAKQSLKQARTLWQNLKALQLGTNLKKFRPRKRELYLLNDGKGRSIGIRGSIFLPRSFLTWLWKDARDRRFVKHFSVNQKSNG